jgi:hypothetical protein
MVSLVMLSPLVTISMSVQLPTSALKTLLAPTL